MNKLTDNKIIVAIEKIFVLAMTSGLVLLAIDSLNTLLAVSPK